MPKVNCAVVGCSSTYGINKWKNELCLEHGDKNVVKGQCPNCERPYSLYCFLAEMTRIQALKWTPKSSDMICSLHFVDGIPTKANPLPTMHMGL